MDDNIIEFSNFALEKESLIDACKIDYPQFMVKFSPVIKDLINRSWNFSVDEEGKLVNSSTTSLTELTATLEKEFTKRELAYIVSTLMGSKCMDFVAKFLA